MRGHADGAARHSYGPHHTACQSAETRYWMAAVGRLSVSSKHYMSSGVRFNASWNRRLAVQWTVN
jgi:hypothetical protein